MWILVGLYSVSAGCQRAQVLAALQPKASARSSHSPKKTRGNRLQFSTAVTSSIVGELALVRFCYLCAQNLISVLQEVHKQHPELLRTEAEERTAAQRLRGSHLKLESVCVTFPSADLFCKSCWSQNFFRLIQAKVPKRQCNITPLSAIPISRLKEGSQIFLFAYEKINLFSKYYQVHMVWK